MGGVGLVGRRTMNHRRGLLADFRKLERYFFDFFLLRYCHQWLLQQISGATEVSMDHPEFVRF